MTFEELHEAVEDNNSVSEEEALRLINKYYKQEKNSKQDIINRIEKSITESIICLDENYNEIIKSLCFLEYESLTVYESKTLGEISDFLKNCIKQLNRFLKKIDKYSNYRKTYK